MAATRSLSEDLSHAIENLNGWSQDVLNSEDKPLGWEVIQDWLAVTKKLEKRSRSLRQREIEKAGRSFFDVYLPTSFSFQRLSRQHPSAAGLDDRCYLALLRARAWPALASKEGQPQLGEGFLEHLRKSLSYNHPLAQEWLFQAVTPENVERLFSHKPYQELRVADQGFTQGPVSDWACLLRQLPLDGLKNLVEKGADPNKDDGKGWPVCCHALGFYEDPERVEWLLEKGADPLCPEGSEKALKSALIGVMRGWGVLLTGSRASTTVKAYVVDRLNQWPEGIRREALDEIKTLAPGVQRCLVEALLESKPSAFSSRRAVRL